MMHKFSRKTGSERLYGIIFIAICIAFAGNGYAQSASNDHIFPAAAGAKPFINFDSKGFLINGKREFLVSAGMEYARVPHELWYDRLLRLKRDGFNCIEIYTFWNFHEPQEGKFNFSGDHDLDAFLKLVKKMGMYVIARVGPYYCAEWDNGGYPLWLRFKPGLRVREDNAAFEKYTDLFWDTLMPVIRRNQINHGGAVILVQLENEHPDGWGTYMPNGYFRHLRDKALSLGLEVPYFFSGLHHSNDPAGDGKLDDPARPNPWISTEFWSVWFTGYSSTIKEARLYERRTWRIIANGGNGYNYYMAHGGSNFGYSNNDEDAASYDYGAAVGQAGDLRPIYYSFKRTALFARSFADILENSTDATALYSSISTDPGIHITARHSSAGDIIFLDNPADSSLTIRTDPETTQGLPVHYTMQLGPKEIFPVIHDFKINKGLTLQWGFAKILGISSEGNSTTLVVYGKPGTSAPMYFMPADHHQIKLMAKFTDGDKPSVYLLLVNNLKLSVLAVNENLADRTWFIGHNVHQYIVSGPLYAGELQERNHAILLTTERPWTEKDSHSCWIFSSYGLKQLHETGRPGMERKKTLLLSPWEVRHATAEAMPGFHDKGWKESDTPLQMGADGDLTADAWYRTNFSVDTAGTYTLQVKGGDRAIVFVDGKKASSINIKNEEIMLNLSKGKHLLAVFTAHDGRDKLAGFLGAMDFVDAKGLYGKALLVKGRNSILNLTDWHFLKARSPEDIDQGLPREDTGGWEKYSIGQDAFNLKKGFGWFSTTLNNPPAGVTQIQLEFRSVDENATVFVNGIRLGRHEGWNSPFGFTINRADTLRTPIILTLFVENYSNEGGIDQPVHANYLLPSTQQLSGWRMRGGIGDPETINDWKTDDGKMSGEGPCFFRSSFHLAANAGSKAIYRVTTKGLGHGSVWVNGHNLGRYPEKIPVNGLYIPECWMKDGKNTLIIYDEDGKYPAEVSVSAEIAACRDVEMFSCTQDIK